MKEKNNYLEPFDKKIMYLKILPNNILCGSCNTQAEPEAYMSYDINKPSIENFIKNTIEDNIFETRVEIILIFETGLYTWYNTYTNNFIELEENHGLDKLKGI